MNVSYQVKHRLQAPTPARKIDISHWFPCGADGQQHVRYYTKISRMDRLPDFLRHGALLSRSLRAHVELRYQCFPSKQETDLRRGLRPK